MEKEVDFPKKRILCKGMMGGMMSKKSKECSSSLVEVQKCVI